MPRLLTSKAFVDRVVQFQADTVEKAAALDQRKVAREERAVVIAKWNQEEEHRKDVNAVIRELWEVEVEEWEAERTLAKTEKRKAGWKKPVLKGALLPAIPKLGKPLVVDGDLSDPDGPSSSSGSDT